MKHNRHVLKLSKDDPSGNQYHQCGVEFARAKEAGFPDSEIMKPLIKSTMPTHFNKFREHRKKKMNGMRKRIPLHCFCEFYTGVYCSGSEPIRKQFQNKQITYFTVNTNLDFSTWCFSILTRKITTDGIIYYDSKWT